VVALVHCHGLFSGLLPSCFIQAKSVSEGDCSIVLILWSLAHFFEVEFRFSHLISSVLDKVFFGYLDNFSFHQVEQIIIWFSIFALHWLSFKSRVIYQFCSRITFYGNFKFLLQILPKLFVVCKYLQLTNYYLVYLYFYDKIDLNSFPISNNFSYRSFINLTVLSLKEKLTLVTTFSELISLLNQS